MRFNRKTTLTTLALIGAAVASVAADAAKDTSHSHENVRLHAVAVNMSNVGRQGATSVDIGIDRWSTDEETTQLKQALIEQGQGDVAAELQKLPRVGFIRRSNGGLGWDVHYARRNALPNGGYRILIATDRPMSFYERSQQPETARYDLIVAELRIDKNGKGEGKLVPAARVRYVDSDATLEVENYASEPVQLKNVIDMSAKADKSEKSDKSPARQQE